MKEINPKLNVIKQIEKAGSSVQNIYDNPKVGAFRRVFVRECKRLASEPIYWFAMFLAPVLCYIFFTTLMSKGLPVNMPIGVVDMDQSANSHSVIRNLDALQMPEIVAHYPDVSQASSAMQRAHIYGFYYIPHHFSSDLTAQRQPKVSFYTNNSILIAGSLLYKDFKTMSELASGAATRQILYAHGITDEQSMSLLQPIVIDPHLIGNPWVNYSIYLNNTLVPGILMVMIFMITVYSIGVEIKDRTARQWLKVSDHSMWTALVAKLLPQTIIFTAMGCLYDSYLYGYLHYPCNSGIAPMIFATLCFVIACQATGVVMIGTFPTLRYGLSFATLWGMVSFSISGFSFPCMGMHPSLHGLANLFPLRHYVLICIDQALNGYSMVYSWRSYLALLLFMLLTFIIMPRLKKALIYYRYVP